MRLVICEFFSTERILDVDTYFHPSPRLDAYDQTTIIGGDEIIINSDQATIEIDYPFHFVSIKSLNDEDELKFRFKVFAPNRIHFTRNDLYQIISNAYRSVYGVDNALKAKNVYSSFVWGHYLNQLFLEALEVEQNIYKPMIGS
jgi:hypothetical protein